MPIESIVDSHFHLWDPGLIRYPWLDENALLNRRYALDDYRMSIASCPIEAMVFVECDAAAASEQEVAWVSELAKDDSRIRGVVARAPLEKGRAAAVELFNKLKQYPLLRGVRRIIQSEPDVDFCLQPSFVQGVRALADFDLSFDVCIGHRQLASVVKLAQIIPDVVMILNHIGKPAIRDRAMFPWAQDLRALARCSNVMCKISGVATEADHQHWTPEQLRPYIDAAMDAFGFDRMMFGSDWPVSTRAIRYERWVELLDDILAGVAASDQRKFWRDNAIRIYRL